VAGGLVHWDDVEPVRRDEGHLAASWRYLGRAAGAGHMTVNRIQIDPNRWSTPAHVEGEEIFFVLGGSGLSWQDGKVYEVREGDCIVHRAGREAHTLRPYYPHSNEFYIRGIGLIGRLEALEYAGGEAERPG
jgi:uncharacterized cupin superfamily protein